MVSMMKNISRSPVRRSHRSHCYYLKPGALAQFRNSRIISRSTTTTTTSLVSRSLSQPLDPISPSHTSVAEATAARNLTIEQVPHLLRKIYGPYSVQRKKLAAARSVSSMMMLIMNPPINSMLVEPPTSVLNSDVVAIELN